jgi:hypothetical protein
MRINVVGPVKRNFPFGTEIAFMKGFLRLGHEVSGIDPTEKTVPVHMDPDFTLIFKTGHQLNPHLARLPGPKIVYQPDDLRFPHIQQLMREMRSVCDYALTFDDDGAKEVVKPDYGYKKAQTLLLTADDELYRPMGLERDIDFLFIGSLGGPQSHASRRRMIDILRANGFTVECGETYNIPLLVSLYNRAKVVLNHATDVGQPFGQGYGYQCRHFEVGMTGTCLLSNSIISEYDEIKPGPRKWVRFGDEMSLVQQARNLLRTGLWEFEGKQIYDEIRESHLPEHRAAEVIEFVRNL